MHRSGAIVLVLCVFACDRRKAPPVEEPRVNVELRDVSVVAVAQTLAKGAHTSVVIEPAAAVAAGCAHVTLVSGGPKPVSQLVALTTDALRSAGFAMRATPNGLVIGVLPGRVLPPCPAPTPVEPAPSFAESARVVGEVIEVERRALTRLDRDTLAGVRAVDSLREGQPSGVRLFGIREGTALAVLGFQNGDTILRLGTYTIRDRASALEAFSRVQHETDVNVDLERRGQMETRRFRIVDHAR